MTNYIPYTVNLSENQKVKLAKALASRSPITLRLMDGELSGNDELMLTKTQIGRIQKAMSQGKGVDIKISKTQIRDVVKEGGNLFTSLMSMGTKLLPMATNLATKALPGLTTGVLSSLAGLATGKVLGSGQTGGFLIPQNKIDQLIAYKHLLTAKQKQDILNTLQSGGCVKIKPTKKQSGGFLGTLHASIGVPLLLNALTGKGLRNRPSYGNGMQNRPYMMNPPIYGSWNRPVGMGMKKKRRTKKKTGQGILFGKNSPFNSIPILGSIF